MVVGTKGGAGGDGQAQIRGTTERGMSSKTLTPGHGSPAASRTITVFEAPPGAHTKTGGTTLVDGSGMAAVAGQAASDKTNATRRTENRLEAMEKRLLLSGLLPSLAT